MKPKPNFLPGGPLKTSVKANIPIMMLDNVEYQLASLSDASAAAKSNPANSPSRTDMPPAKIIAADLFCGAGGTSTGLLLAAQDLGIKVDLLAINHWPIAVNSHTLNHPTVTHKCATLENIKPRTVVPGGHLHLLCASPECTNHSVAAGGKPKNDQSRAGAWNIIHWCTDLQVDNVFMENVWEWWDWGPLHSDHSNGCTHAGTKDDPCLKKCHFNKPIKERKGEFRKAFIASLEAMNYTVEVRKQCAADFGDPTTRKRLILMARSNKRPINWPAPTHGPQGKAKHRAAREIIDWTLKGNSIFNRKKPLSANTMRRIEAGLRKFGGPNAQPFLVKLYGISNVSSVDNPMPTITAGGNHIALCQPFLIPYHAGQGREDNRSHSIEEPLRTQDTQNRHALVEPFLIHTNHEGGDRCHSLDNPIPTVTGGEMALVEPFVIGQQSCASPRSVLEPLPTIAGAGAIALVQPFLTKYYGTGLAKSISEPLDTITGKARFALVEPHGIDITLRMLKPHELAAAMSFPPQYRFYGTLEQQTKQIGNAVPVMLAKAHCLSLLSWVEGIYTPKWQIKNLH